MHRTPPPPLQSILSLWWVTYFYITIQMLARALKTRVYTSKPRFTAENQGLLVKPGFIAENPVLLLKTQVNR